MQPEEVEQRVRDFIDALPEGIELVAAAKTRTPEEVAAAVRGGVKIIGYNYVQEAQEMRQRITGEVQWHMIGHLQRNKAKHAIELFDMIETLDNVRLAKVLQKRCADAGKSMPVLIEINSGREANKSGVLPEELDDLIETVRKFDRVNVRGLMTMGPFPENPEELCPYFRETRKAFERLAKANLANVDMRYLSMGMSDSYEIAIEEGANLIRIGTRLFGERSY